VIDDIEAVVSRWQRRNGKQRFVFALFATFDVSEMMPGTIVYDRLRLAIALQRLVHAFRGPLLRLARLLRFATAKE
jgi:hypothetical protein